MKQNTLIYILGAVLLLGVIGYLLSLTFSKNSPTSQTPSENNKIEVSASFYPLYFLASEIAKEKAEVFNITPAGVEPHDYDPTPQDIVRVQKSKLLVINGAGFEPWLDKIKGELQNTAIVDTTEGITLQEGTEEHEEEEVEEHEEEPKDPHVWLSPTLAKSQVDKILQGYIQVDPSNRAFYEANTKDLKQKLDELDKKFEQGLSSCKQKNFVTSHAAFGYLAQEYNLTQVSISGLSPEEEPSPAEMAEVTKFARENNVKYIFFETLVSPKLSETIAKEVGAKTLVLDPIEGIEQGKNYFTVMEENLRNLQTALECKK